MRPQLHKWLISILVLSFAGFLDAVYLTIHHYLNGSIPCILLKGCDIVTKSSYSVILGVPVALLGALYYLTVIVLAVIYLDREWKSSLPLIKLSVSIGFIFSLWFLYVQAFILHSFCLYCIASAAITTTLFILSLFMLKFRQKIN